MGNQTKLVLSRIDIDGAMHLCGYVGGPPGFFRESFAAIAALHGWSDRGASWVYLEPIPWPVENDDGEVVGTTYCGPRVILLADGTWIWERPDSYGRQPQFSYIRFEDWSGEVPHG